MSLKLFLLKFPISATEGNIKRIKTNVNGDKELAIKNYEKSLELNPKNTNTIEMLKNSRKNSGLPSAAKAVGHHLKIFKKTVMIRALAKSIKKAPTIETTRKARGARPYLSTSTFILAMALAVVPIMKP